MIKRSKQKQITLTCGKIKLVSYKLYFRKSSFKKDIKNGNLLLELIRDYKPKSFLEIGVLEGATSRNVCELLNKINQKKFNYTGIDLFGLDKIKNNLKEFTPLSNKHLNPLKYIYFNYILKLNPNNIKAVEFLLKKFNKSINLHKGYSEDILESINLSNIDFVFLDGGHSFNTVSKDLEILLKKLKNNSIIICDDYNITHYGVKEAVDEIKNKHFFKDLGRFALIKVIK